MVLTPLQNQALTLIENLLKGELSAATPWLPPSFVMAHIQVESAWRVDIHSTDGLGSIGLMQVLPATAAQVGVTGAQSRPEVSVLAGMRYLVACHTTLMHYRNHPEIETITVRGRPHPINPRVYEGDVLDYSLVCAAYNAGPGNVLAGFNDANYTQPWAAAQSRWAGVDALRGLEPSPVPLVPHDVTSHVTNMGSAPTKTADWHWLPSIDWSSLGAAIFAAAKPVPPPVPVSVPEPEPAPEAKPAKVAKEPKRVPEPVPVPEEAPPEVDNDADNSADALNAEQVALNQEK